MKNTILTFCCILLQQSLFAENKDWLIDGSPYKTEVNLSSDKKQIELTNGLLRRSFSLTPNGATIALDNLMTGQNELRCDRKPCLSSMEKSIQSEVWKGSLSIIS